MTSLDPYSQLARLYKLIIADNFLKQASNKLPKKVMKSDLVPGSCVFCDDIHNLRSFQRNYQHNGTEENYTIMLLTCYNIEVVGFHNEKNEGDICESCIDRLRDACSFRRQVESVDEVLEESCIASNENQIDAANASLNFHSLPEKSRVKDNRDIQLNYESSNDFDYSNNFFSNYPTDPASQIVNQNYNVHKQNQSEMRIRSNNIQTKPKRKKSIRKRNSNTSCSDEDFHYDNILKSSLSKSKPPPTLAVRGEDDFFLKWNEQCEKAQKEVQKKIVEKKMKEKREKIPPLDSSATTCPVCQKKFQFHYYLKSHYIKHFNKHFICEECGNACSCQSALTVHMKTHLKNLPCKVCGKICKNQNTLKHHLQNHHAETPLAYRCQICRKKFSDKKAKISHLSTVHGVDRHSHKCEACGKAYTRAAHLSAHLKKVHQKIRNHPCMECDMKFFTNSELTCHMISHTDVKSFHCETCGKSFARKHTLTEHLKIHADIRAHVCEFCGTAFVQRCSLKGHLKTHHQSRNSK